MNATIMKGERSKLLAVVAIMAMVVCAFAVALPATDAAEGDADYSVTDTEGLLDALDTATDGQIIELGTGTYGNVDVVDASNKIYFDSNGYMSILVDTPVTIRAAVDATPVISGALVITAPDVTVQGLTINITYMQNYERNAITVAAPSATITGNTINMVAGSSALCNGIVLYPASNGVYDISGNEFNDFVHIPGNNSNAIMVYENYALNSSASIMGFSERYPADLDYISGELSMGVTQELRMIASNTFDNCQWNYTSSDYNGGSTGGVRETRVIGTEDAPAGGDVFEISGDAEKGYTYTLVMQSSDKLNLELAQNESLVISENAIYDGTITGAGAANVTNNGAYVYTDGAYHVYSFQTLKALMADSDVKTIVLEKDITATDYLLSTVATTVDLNGHMLDMGENMIRAYSATIDLTDEGSTFATNGIVKMSPDTIKTDADSRIELGPNYGFYNTNAGGAVDPDDEFFPTLQVGSIIYDVSKDREYSVYHIQDGGSFIQVGIGHSPVYYDNGPVTDDDYDVWADLFDTSADNYMITVLDWNLRDGHTGHANANTYNDAISVRLSISFTGEPAVGTTQTIPLIISPADPEADVVIGGDDGEMDYGSAEVPEITYTDADETTLEGYLGMIGEEKITITITSDLLEEPLVISYPFTAEQLNGLLPGDYSYTATFPAKNGNYTEFTTESQDFTVNKAIPGITISAPGASEQFYGVESSDIAYYTDVKSGNAYAVRYSGEGIAVSGGIYWINDFRAISEGYGTTSSNTGYFMIMKITADQGFGFQWKFSDYPNSQHFVAAGDSAYIFKYIGNNIDTIRDRDNLSLTIIPDEDSGYASVDYKLDFSGLYRMTSTGYAADANDAKDGITAEGITRDLVADKTMWIVYDAVGHEGEFTAKLYYGDNVIFEQTIPANTDNNRIWYFSFDDAQEIQKLNMYDGLDYELGQGGAYEMVITDSNGAEVASGIAVIPGLAGSGYEASEDKAVTAILNDGISETQISDIVGQTMWIAWYNGTAYSGDVSATLTWDKDDSTDPVVIYTQTFGADVWGTVGPHIWYFTFDPSNYSWIGKENENWDFPNIQFGTYTLTVTQGGITYTDTVVIEPQPSEVDIQNVDLAALGEILGIENFDLYGMSAEDLMDLQEIVTGAISDGKASVSVNGTVFYLPSYEQFWNGAENDRPGYYFAVQIADADGKLMALEQWKGIEVSVNNPNTINGHQTKTYTEFDGYLVFYLGESKPTDGFTDITITVDFDGADNGYYVPVVYTLDLDLATASHTYQVTWDDVYDITETINGQYVVPDYGQDSLVKEFQGWQDENGKLWPAGTKIVLDVVDYDSDYQVTFTAVYAEPDMGIDFVGGGFFSDADDARNALITMGSSYQGGIDANTMLIVYQQYGYIGVTLDIVYNDDTVLVDDDVLLADNGTRTVMISFENGLRDYEMLAGKYSFIFTATPAGGEVESYVYDIYLTDSDIPAEEPVIPEDPTVTIEGLPTSFVTGQEYVFTVSTTAGDYDGGYVLGTAIFSAPEGSYTIWYLENNPANENYGKWMPLIGDSFGPSKTGFPLIDTTSYFKVVFNEADNYDLTVQIVEFANQDNVICDDTAKVIVLDASDLPVYDDRESRQPGDYDLAWELVETEDGYKINVYVVTDKMPDAYRNALSSVWFQVSDADGTKDHLVYLSDNLGSITYTSTNPIAPETKNGIIVGELMLDVPEEWITVDAQGWFADYIWFDIGAGLFINNINAVGITVDPTELNMTVGDEPETVTATVDVITGKYTGTLTWASNNEDVATVENGVITPVAKGTAAITVETDNGLIATVTVNVRDLSGIEIIAPTQTTYYENQPLNTTGLKVEAVYSDGYREEVTDDAIISENPTAVPGISVEVTVSYAGFEQSFYIDVYELDRIAVTVPQNITWNAGVEMSIDDLIASGLTVDAIYAVDGIVYDTVKDVQANCTIVPVVFDEAGVHAVTVIYTDAYGNEAQFSFNVNVVDPTVTE